MYHCRISQDEINATYNNNCNIYNAWKYGCERGVTIIDFYKQYNWLVEFINLLVR